METPGANVLRPREPSELLSETLRVYQRCFRPFVAIAFIAQIPLLLAAVTPSAALEIALTLVAVPVGILAQGAAVYAVVRRYLGWRIFVLDCYAHAWRKGALLIIGGLLFIGVLFICIILSVFIVGIPLLFYILVSWFFFVPVIVLEGRDPPAALERSRRLVMGRWRRTFGIGVLFAFLLGFAGLVLGGPGALLASANQTLGDVYITLAGIVLAPVIPIGTTLVYFDLRVRKEGYTLEQMAAEIGA